VDIDSQYFRQVLGNLPTGVVAITAIDASGSPAGMAVGSFTSVSLEPALVAFLPDRSSTTWPRIQQSGQFCANVLGSEQEAVCRVLATRGADKFRDLDWQPAPSGAPIISGVVAWIDCDIETVHDAGDHYIVIGRVRQLGTIDDSLPLIFYRGGYGRFAPPPSLSAWGDDLLRPMRIADIARRHMELAAERLDAEVFGTVVVEDNLVLIAAAGAIRSRKLITRVGGRIPFVPPVGTVFAAHDTSAGERAWLLRSENREPGYLARLTATLREVRASGYSVDFGHRWHAEMETLIASAGAHGESRAEMIKSITALPADFESPQFTVPASETVGTVNVPVTGHDGGVAMTISLLITRLSRPALGVVVRQLQETASAVAGDLTVAGY